jgi:4-carboxymuconolactone decarboxylase
MSNREKSARYNEGLSTRRKVLGNDHVDRAGANQTHFDAPFQELITEAAWGHVWSRDGLTLRERSIVTIALLAALGHDEEVQMHVRATRNTGATENDICEALLHVAIYAGIPAANHAIGLVKATYQEMAEREQKGGGNDRPTG